MDASQASGEVRGLITEAGITSVVDDFWKDVAELTQGKYCQIRGLSSCWAPKLQIMLVASPRFESIRARVPSLPWDLERSDDQAGSRRSILEVYERALLAARADEINEFVPARLVDREILPFVKDRHVRLEHRGVGLLERAARGFEQYPSRIGAIQRLHRERRHLANHLSLV